MASSFSVRQFVRLGSSVSVVGLSRFGSVFSMSVLDFLHLGSSLSLRSFARLGSSLSVEGGLIHTNVMSSMSVRNFAKLGSALSVVGLSRFGSVFSMSVLDFLHLG